MSSQLKRLFLPYAVAGLSIALVCGVLCGYSWLFGPRWSSEEQRAGDRPIPFRPFSKKRLERELSAGHTVLVHFYANWMIGMTFHVNRSLERPTVRKWLYRKRVIPLDADWTNENAEIEAELYLLDEISVPLIVIYSPQKSPKVLRDLFTEEDVVRALEEIPN